MKRSLYSALALIWVLGSTAWAQTTHTVSADPVACLPREANAIVTASVRPEIKRSEAVRLYFRRLNPAGGFYWVEMLPAGGGAYTTLLPKPEDQRQQELTDEWWEILEQRDWMKIESRDRDWLGDYLESQDHELAEYYVALVDDEGTEIARDVTRLTEVRDRDDCVVGLTRHEFGISQSLVVGETLESQRDREVFHWLCDGIVSRVDFGDVLRPDTLCRSCVVAAGYPAATAAGAIVAATAIDKREPRDVSPVQ